MRAIAIIIFSILSIQTSLCQIPTLVDTLSDDMSPGGTIEILHLYNTPLDRYEIWFVDANDLTSVFLFDSTSFQNAEVVFSPNDQWVAENIEVVSNYRTVELSKRTDGVRFREVEEAQVEKKAWEFFRTSNHLSKLPEYDHTAASIVKWSKDSKSFLVEIEGHGDMRYNDLKHYLDPWYCVFNVENLGATASPEKAKENRRAFHH